MSASEIARSLACGPFPELFGQQMEQVSHGGCLPMPLSRNLRSSPGYTVGHKYDNP